MRVASVRAVRGNRDHQHDRLAGACSFLVGNGFVPLLPGFAEDLGAGEGFTYSALLAAYAGGAVLDRRLLLEWLGRNAASPRVAVISAAVWSAALAAFAFADNYPLALALLFVAGMANLPAWAVAQALVQLAAPAHLRGQVVGLLPWPSVACAPVAG